MVAYGFGFIGMILMFVSRTLDEPARSVWAGRSMLMLGLMFVFFVSYYVLAMLRVYRR